MRALFAPSVPPRCVAIAVAVALAGSLVAAPAAAQGPSSERRSRGGAGDRKEALRRLADGDRKLARGDKLAARGKIEQAFAQFEAALTDYQAAYDAYPDPQIYFPIAQAEQRLGRFVEALQHYQGLLADSKALSPQLRAQVQARLDEVRKNLAALVLDIEPPGADVLIDGKPAGRSPVTQPIFIEPGQHTYEISRSGYRAEEGKVDLLPGKEVRRRVRLRKEAGKVARRPAPRPAPRPVAAVERPSAVPLWIGVGLTSALVIGGTATGIGAASKHSQYEDVTLSVEARRAARTDGQRLARFADIAFGGAIVAGAATAWYYFGVYRPRSAEAGAAARRDALRLEPVVGPDGAGLAVSGTFW